jgi:hypothetical protein
VRSLGWIALAAAVALCGGCGQQSAVQSSTGAQRSATVDQVDNNPPIPQSHPQAVEPVAGVAGSTGEASSGPAVVSVGPPPGGVASDKLARPVSDAVIRKELTASGLTAASSKATMTPSGLALAPLDAPPAVQTVIEAGNQIAKLPYRFGGGHGTFHDTAYDCSGSLSYVLAAAGMLNTTVVSGQLEHWGAPGPGRWITVYANAGHTFMYVAGLRFDTVALAETGTRWSTRPADEPDLNTFVIRHFPGL